MKSRFKNVIHHLRLQSPSRYLQLQYKFTLTLSQLIALTIQFGFDPYMHDTLLPLNPIHLFYFSLVHSLEEKEDGSMNSLENLVCAFSLHLLGTEHGLLEMRSILHRNLPMLFCIFQYPSNTRINEELNLYTTNVQYEYN